MLLNKQNWNSVKDFISKVLTQKEDHERKAQNANVATRVGDET